MKREKIEKMAEKQAEQILAACTFAATPTTTTTATPATKAAAETTPLLVRWVNNSGWYMMIYKQIHYKYLPPSPPPSPILHQHLRTFEI